jgi:hypothetical protein
LNGLPRARLIVLSVWLAAIAWGCAVAPAVQAPYPESLVGEWWGTWQSVNVPGYSGQYYLTISYIDGNTVWGGFRVHPAAGIRTIIEGPFQGTLKDGRLLSGGVDSRMELTITGNEMAGHAQSTLYGNTRMRLIKATSR